MSHPRCMLFDNRKYQRSGSDVDRTACGMIAEAASLGVGRDAPRTKGGGGGGGPDGRGAPGTAGDFRVLRPIQDTRSVPKPLFAPAG